MDNILSGNEATNPAAAPAETDAFLTSYLGDSAPGTEDPKPAEAADQADAQQAEETPKDTGTDYTIKYKGKEEVLHLTPEQLIAMLQKGRAYDEVKQQRDDAQKGAKDIDALNRMADYLAANNGMTRAEYLEYIGSQASEDGIRARIAEEHPDLDPDIVDKLVELELSKVTAAKEAAEDEKAAADIAALTAEYPDAKIDDLPADVQADIENGMKPVEAMRMHELRELRKTKAELDTQIAALQKEKSNAFRSPGRADTRETGGAADPFLKGYLGGVF